MLPTRPRPLEFRRRNEEWLLAPHGPLDPVGMPSSPPGTDGFLLGSDSVDVVLCHGVRQVRDLCYRDELLTLKDHAYLGEMVRDRLLYYPAVTREDHVEDGRRHRGRLTDLLASGQLPSDLGLAPLDPAHDRAMLCGSPGMLADFRALLDGRGFTAAPRIGVPGNYVALDARAAKSIIRELKAVGGNLRAVRRTA